MNLSISKLLLQGLVIAGIADYARPAEKLSPAQSTALTATGRDLCLASVFIFFFLRKSS